MHVPKTKKNNSNVPYLILTEKPKATTKPWFGRLLRQLARKWSGSILRQTHTCLLACSKPTQTSGIRRRKHRASVVTTGYPMQTQ